MYGYPSYYSLLDTIMGIIMLITGFAFGFVAVRIALIETQAWLRSRRKRRAWSSLQGNTFLMLSTSRPRHER